MLTCVFPAQHSAQSSVDNCYRDQAVDNCYRDQAVTNAAQLAGLLSSADVPVAEPSG